MMKKNQPEFHDLSLSGANTAELRPNLQKIEVVLFDLDDTLIDTLNTSFALVIKTAEYFNLQPPTYEHYLKTYGGSFPRMVKAWFQGIEVNSDLFRQQFELYGTETDSPQLFNVAETFKALKNANYRIGIVTNSGAERTKLKLRHAGVNPEILDCLVTHNDTNGVLKPDPAGLLLANKLLSVNDSEKVIYVGNAYEDQLAAHAAGVGFCGVNQAENWENRVDERSYFLENAGEIISLLNLNC